MKEIQNPSFCRCKDNVLFHRHTHLLSDRGLWLCPIVHINYRWNTNKILNTILVLNSENRIFYQCRCLLLILMVIIVMRKCILKSRSNWNVLEFKIIAYFCTEFPLINKTNNYKIKYKMLNFILKGCKGFHTKYLTDIKAHSYHNWTQTYTYLLTNR